METINNIELTDPQQYPDDDMLRNVLGNSFAAYEAVLRLYEENGLTYEWRYYRDGKAWLCKVQHKKRTIVWMSAWKEFMQATVYFPEKYIEKVFELELTVETVKRFRNTRKTGKSMPCIFEARGGNIPADFEKVMKLKMALK